MYSHLNVPSDVAISLNRYSAPTLLSYFRINLAVSEFQGIRPIVLSDMCKPFFSRINYNVKGNCNFRRGTCNYMPCIYSLDRVFVYVN